MDILEHLRQLIIKELNVDVKIETSRRRDIIDAFRIFCDIARDKTKYSYQHIGDWINRHHSTVIHLSNSSQDLKETDREYFMKYEKILEQTKPINAKTTLMDNYKLHIGRAKYYKRKLNEITNE